jgi:hypothetical protein
MFGKILALLNMLGAVGLVYLALMDYGKRQSWSHSVLLHDVILDGLPLDEKEADKDKVPLVERLGGSTSELFSKAGGNPVATQRQEVERVKGILDEQLQKAETDKARQQGYLLARFLLAVTDAYLPREQLLACVNHLATKDAADNLRKRCQAAMRVALRIPKYTGDDDVLKKAEKTFPDAFRLAFRVEGGPPAEMFVSILLRFLPADRDKAAGANIDQAFDQALEAQRTELRARYDSLFNEALGQPSEGGAVPNLQGQKAAIARLLFGLCVPLTEDAIQTGSGKEE